MFALKAFTFLIATLPAFFYVSLLIGKPKRLLNTSLLWWGMLAGCLAGLSILILKTFFFQGTIKPPSKETLTTTLFIAFIEAGLLEEFFKNGFYLICYKLLKKHFNFEVNPYLFYALGAAVGLGFGIAENGYYALSPNTGQVSIVLGRLYTTIPAHMFMNIIFAYFHSKRVNLLIALLASVTFHAVFDFFALPSTLLGTILVKVMIVISIGFAVWMGRDLMQRKDLSRS